MDERAPRRRNSTTSLSVPFLPDALSLAVGSLPHPALLESDGSANRGGRFSILTAEPREIFEAVDARCSILKPNGSPIAAFEGDPFGRFGEWLSHWGLTINTSKSAEPPPQPLYLPFQGGAIGYFGYDLAPHLEKLPRKAERDFRLPDLRFGLYDWAILIDHWKREARLWSFNLVGETSNEADAEARLNELWGRIAPRLSDHPTPSAGKLSSAKADFRRSDYLEAVKQALEYIRAGDIFQVNFSQRFVAQGHPCPLGLHCRLKRASPAPFAAFLQWRDQAVISASPEWFCEVRDGRIVTRPIKGTRPRGATLDDDERLIRELRASAKDQAELTMIVDLERNDLGRICEYGTVQVTGSAQVESFAQVHHLVATVEGRLHPHIGPVEIMRAIFPGGSITGAPKIRAMEIIDELEPCRRGVYTGSIGYITQNGESMFNIAIRTLSVDGDRVAYHVGGGIVADSDPVSEYEETLHKGRGLRQVLEAATG